MVSFGLIFLGCFSLHGFMEPSVPLLLWRAMVAIGVLFWMLEGRHQERWFRAFTDPIPWVWGGMVAWMALGSLWASTPMLTNIEVEQHALILCALIVWADLQHLPQARGRCLRWWWLGCWVSVVYAFYQQTVVMPLLLEELSGVTLTADETLQKRFMIRAEGGEWNGFRIYPNLFGFSMLIFLMTLGARAWRRILLPAALTGVALVLSGSKSAILLLALWLWFELCSKWVERGPRRWIVLCLPLLATPWLMEPLEASFVVRWHYWATALDMAIHHPLGLGAGNFSEHYLASMTPLATEVKLAHNDPLQILCEQGGVGLALFVVFLVLLWRRRGSQDQGAAVSRPDPQTGIVALMMLGLTSWMGLGPMDLVGFEFLLFLAKGLGLLPLGDESLKLRKGAILLALVAFSLVDFPWSEWPMILILMVLVYESKDLPTKGQSRHPRWGMAIGTLVGSFFLVLRLQAPLQEGLEAPSRLEAHLATQGSLPSFQHESAFLSTQALVEELGGELKAEFYGNWLELRPRSPSLWAKLAVSLEDPHEQLKAWRRARELHPRQARYHFHEAESLWLLGRQDEAKEAYGKALERHAFIEGHLHRHIDLELLTLKPVQVGKANARRSP